MGAVAIVCDCRIVNRALASQDDRIFGFKFWVLYNAIIRFCARNGEDEGHHQADDREIDFG